MKATRLAACCLLALAGASLCLLPAGCRDGAPPAARKATYHCPMHPTIVDDRASDCPVCGMLLVPIEPAAPQGGTSAVPGQAAVTIPPEARQRMGLALATVTRRPLTRTIRTSARIVPDETRLFRVTSKVEGWVETLHVATTGQSVRRGDPLLTLYSPSLLAAQQEFLTALAAANHLPPRAGPEAAAGARRLLAAARQRLDYWDVPAALIARLEASGQIEKTVTLEAPAGGVVTEKTVLAGQRIEPGDSLMVVSDLAAVWGEADLYAADLPYVKTGMTLRLDLPYWPDRSFEGAVTFIAPEVDPATRTVRMRIALANADLVLKPGMYADARLSVPLGEALAVPEAAVLRTGERAYVFRDAGDGRLEPVALQLGPRAEGCYVVRDGLRDGDRVVVAAGFLVDSESSMRAALEALTAR